MNTPSGTEAKVCADIVARQQLGIAKYGMTVEENPLTLRQWLQHAYEEGLDKVVYLKRAIDEMDKQSEPDGSIIIGEVASLMQVRPELQGKSMDEALAMMQRGLDMMEEQEKMREREIIRARINAQNP